MYLIRCFFVLLFIDYADYLNTINHIINILTKIVKTSRARAKEFFLILTMSVEGLSAGQYNIEYRIKDIGGSKATVIATARNGFLLKSPSKSLAPAELRCST